jgi:hypothetical protein
MSVVAGLVVNVGAQISRIETVQFFQTGSVPFVETAFILKSADPVEIGVPLIVLPLSVAQDGFASIVTVADSLSVAVYV